MLLYFVLIYLLIGRIDSVLTTVEIGVCKCNPDSFGIVPVLLLLAHYYSCGLILASTSILKVRHLTRHRKETSKYLLSPLLLIFNVNGGSLNNYTHIHTTLKTVTATKNRQGFVHVAHPTQEATVRATA